MMALRVQLYICVYVCTAVLSLISKFKRSQALTCQKKVKETTALLFMHHAFTAVWVRWVRVFIDSSMKRAALKSFIVFAMTVREKAIHDHTSFSLFWCKWTWFSLSFASLSLFFGWRVDYSVLLFLKYLKRVHTYVQRTRKSALPHSLTLSLSLSLCVSKGRKERKLIGFLRQRE